MALVTAKVTARFGGLSWAREGLEMGVELFWETKGPRPGASAHCMHNAAANAAVGWVSLREPC
jgi:hypothetical protein